MTYSDLVSAFSNGSILIAGASYIGKPIDSTIMFITKKVNALVVNLEGHYGCVVFAETGIDLSVLSEAAKQKNIIIENNNPQYLYAQFANIIADKQRKLEQKKRYTLTDGGYYIGENVFIEDGVSIEPGCLIGHGVTIGAGSRILYGAVIKNAVVGKNAIINEYAVVGSYGFTMALDENGNKFRIPTLGKVILGDNVEIGAHDNISCGSGGDTVIEDFCKIDALVHIGHDVHFGRNVEATAGGIIGGFVDAADGAYVGINAVLRNRINIGSNAIIGMGSTVTKSVDPNMTVAGNPARPFIKNGDYVLNHTTTDNYRQKENKMQFRDLQKQYEVLKPQIDAGMFDVATAAHFISGPQVKELEKALAEYVGVKHCITCANGTDAITIAMRAWGVGEGDAVFVPDFTFFSSGECPADEGATPIFVDVDERTYNLDPVKLEESVKKVISEGKYKARAVVAVDLFGLPANYPAIKKVCDKYGLLLMEDAAQGFGGCINGKRAGAFGDISTTSFFPAKPLGCYGDGGAIFTDNDGWADLIRSICVHGKATSNPNDPNAKYNNIRIGKNSRLDTLQAAILLPKFEAFKEYELTAINEVAAWYTERLKDTNLVLPNIQSGFYSSWAQYTVQLPEGIDRKEIQAKLKSVGIPSMVYYAKPMHLQGAFADTDSAIADCPVTERLCATVLSLPIDPYKTKGDIDFIVAELKKALA